MTHEPERAPEPSNDTLPTDRPATDEAPPPRVLEEVLVEEVSIDGMCGVY